jgi:RNA polymerase sigma factor (sigma-70 family)
MVAKSPQPKPDFATFVASLDGWLQILAERLARSCQLELDDARQEILLRLWRDYDTWDPNRGSATTWSQMKAMHIGGVMNKKRHARKRLDMPSAFAALYYDDDSPIDIVDRRSSDPREVAELREEIGRVRAAIPRLNDSQRAVIEATFLEEGKLHEAGERIGASKQYASILRSKAIEELRGMLT